MRRRLAHERAARTNHTVPLRRTGKFPNRLMTVAQAAATLRLAHWRVIFLGVTVLPVRLASFAG